MVRFLNLVDHTLPIHRCVAHAPFFSARFRGMPALRAGGGFGAVSVNKVSPAVIKFSGVPRRTPNMSPSVLADNLNTVFAGDAHKASMSRKSLEYSASQPSFDSSSSAAGSATPDRHAPASLRGSSKRTPHMSSTPMTDNVGALWNNSPLTGGDKSARYATRRNHLLGGRPARTSPIARGQWRLIHSYVIVCESCVGGCRRQLHAATPPSSASASVGPILFHDASATVAASVQAKAEGTNSGGLVGACCESYKFGTAHHCWLGCGVMRFCRRFPSAPSRIRSSCW
jgi:hypothetical protein